MGGFQGDTGLLALPLSCHPIEPSPGPLPPQFQLLATLLGSPALSPHFQLHSVWDGGTRGLGPQRTPSYSMVRGEFHAWHFWLLSGSPLCFVIKPGSCFAFQNFDEGLVWKSKTGPGWFSSLPSRSDGPNSPLRDVGTPD